MDRPLHHVLTDDEVTGLASLLRRLEDSGTDPGDPVFFDRAWELMPLVPAGIRRLLAGYRLGETSSCCLIEGWPVDDRRIGPTPPDWRTAARENRARTEELLLGLFAMCVGEVFGWSTLQSGRLIHNVIPVAGEERRQSGHGQVRLEWHTEDGFHPYRCDYLLLFGLRNPDLVPTLVSSVRDVRLSEQDEMVLRSPLFEITPDDEHLRQRAASSPEHPGLLRVRAMHDRPVPVPVLSGGAGQPYLRIDPVFMRAMDADPDGVRALQALVDELDRVQQRILVRPGSLLLIDNYRAVHGRAAYRARFDGRDRWLKKVLVTQSLRKSRAQRARAASRLIV